MQLFSHCYSYSNEQIKPNKIVLSLANLVNNAIKLNWKNT